MSTTPYRDTDDCAAAPAQTDAAPANIANLFIAFPFAYGSDGTAKMRVIPLTCTPATRKKCPAPRTLRHRKVFGNKRAAAPVYSLTRAFDAALERTYET
jgi:hypothetical protein